MKRQHTAGPWSAAHIYGTCYTVQCAGGQYHIGTVRGKQNANLIAATPDMFAALKKIAAISEFDTSSMGYVVGMAKAVINQIDPDTVQP